MTDDPKLYTPLMHTMYQGGSIMEGSYGVQFGNEIVGKVQVITQGLYCRFICRCRHSAQGIYRLILSSEDAQVNLGVLVPEGDGYALEKSVPRKHLGEGEPRFYLAPSHSELQGFFVPISPEEPFGYIARLKDAFLSRQNGQLGAFIKEDRKIRG